MDKGSESSEDISEGNLSDVSDNLPVTKIILKELEALNYPCFICDHKIKDTDSKKILEHLLIAHHFVIGDIEKIPDLPKYLKYWQERFTGKTQKEWTEFATNIVSQQPSENKEDYYLLSDVLPEDKTLREDIVKKSLASKLKKQQDERNVPFNRKCIFCRDRFDQRKPYFLHLFLSHGLNIGSPDNLVEIEEFLDILQYKIESWICIYCEKTFKSPSVLKLHMKKKKHYKINSNNTQYDRFYIVNYVEPGKNWKEKKDQNDSSDSEDLDIEDYIKSQKTDNWDEWNNTNDFDEDEDEYDEPMSVCLFCEKLSGTAQESFDHAKKEHNFDLKAIQKENNLDFYQSIRIINYIRHSISENACPKCRISFAEPTKLFHHMKETSHYSVPLEQNSIWMNDDRYLQPLNEEDPLLMSSYLRPEEDDFSSEDDSENRMKMKKINVREDIDSMNDEKDSGSIHVLSENYGIDEKRFKELQQILDKK